jgi:hypothetical protein
VSSRNTGGQVLKWILGETRWEKVDWIRLAPAMAGPCENDNETTVPQKAENLFAGSTHYQHFKQGSAIAL